ncbi:head decoration protein [Endozoicomonas sp. 4G]|uniref:head decoration protein n=1 Tax=Endozoicomonas sp. 4G TaxID=2872754 RepID=UPI001BCE8C2C|nr:head decoration protein [Endozoicomonas sp. 4G]
MTMITEGPRAGDYLLSESNGAQSRESAVIAAGADLVAGTVLGQLTKSVVALTAAASGNTGADTGLASVTVTLGAQALPGRYVLECTAAVVVDPATPAQWSITAPNGLALQSAASGVAYAGSHLNLTLGVGTTPWAAGDLLYVDVSGTGQYIQHNPDAVTGAEIAVAVLYESVDAAEAIADGVITARLAEVDDAALTWHTGITDAEKAAAVASLAARHIIVR